MKEWLWWLGMSLSEYITHTYVCCLKIKRVENLVVAYSSPINVQRSIKKTHANSAEGVSE